MVSDNGGPQLTWANIIGTLIFMITLISMGAAFLQNQMAHVDKEIETLRSMVKDGALLLRQRDTEIKEEIRSIHSELLQRRNEFPTQFEFKAFKEANEDRWSRQFQINQRTMDNFLSTKAFEVWRSERDRRIDVLEKKPN